MMLIKPGLDSVRRLAMIVPVVALFLPFSPLGASMLAPFETVPINSEFSNLEAARQQDSCFSTQVPTSGILLADVSTPTLEPRFVLEYLGEILDFVPSSEYSVASGVVNGEQLKERGALMLHQTLTSFQIFVGREGEHSFCVYLQDQRESEGGFDLAIRFVEFPVEALDLRGEGSSPGPGDITTDGDPLEDEIVPDPKPFRMPQPKDGDPLEDEIVPDPTPSPQPIAVLPMDGDPLEDEIVPDPTPYPQPIAVFPMDGDPLEDEIVPDPTPSPQPIAVFPMDGDPLEDEIVPDPTPSPQPIAVLPMDGDPLEDEIVPDPTPARQPFTTSEPANVLGSLLLDFCRTLRVDDHSEFSACASQLILNDVESVGLLENDSDEDSFTFTLRSWRSVSLDMATTEPLVFGLFDANGQLLGKQFVGSEGLVSLGKTLAPGRYMVRVLPKSETVVTHYAIVLRNLRN